MRILLLNQTFHPDVMATGQYLSEVAVELVRQGHAVTVVTGDRAYDSPDVRFPKSEVWNGVRILRVGSTAFGKTAKWRRAADFASFIIACVCRLLLLPRHDVIVALTTPPLISFIGACLAAVRRSRFIYWVMDMNPDEAIAAGWLRQHSLAARVLEWMSRFSFRHAHKIIALDRFMADRIQAKGIPPDKISVVPPWSHDASVFFDPAGRDAFRKAHGLQDKFVVMYSGNHSPVHPLDTLLSAARQFATDPNVAFCFIGGGSEWRKIRNGESVKQPSTAGQFSAPSASQVTDLSPQVCSPTPVSPSDPSSCSPTQVSGFSPHPYSPLSTTSRPLTTNKLSAFNFQPSTILALPYQPLDKLSASLSAADLHVVVLGNPMLGLVHPCKIYNILSVGAPVLYIGPEPSHVTEIFDTLKPNRPLLRAAHGDIPKVVAHIQAARAHPGRSDFHVPNTPFTPWDATPYATGANTPASPYSRQTLLPKITSVITSPC